MRFSKTFKCFTNPKLFNGNVSGCQMHIYSNRYNYHQIIKNMPINQPDKFIRKAYLFTLTYNDDDI